MNWFQTTYSPVLMLALIGWTVWMILYTRRRALIAASMIGVIALGWLAASYLYLELRFVRMELPPLPPDPWLPNRRWTVSG